MSAPSRKRFCVRFTATSCYKTAIRARTEFEAVAKAQRLWATQGEQAFTCFAGDTDGWDANPE
jgi:hypothetical protein